MLFRWVWLMASLLLVGACANKRSAGAVASYEEAGDYGGGAEYDDMDEAPMAASASGRSSRAAPKKSAGRPAPPPPPRAPGSLTPPAEPNDPIAPEKPASKRMVFYEGSTTLRVARVAEAVAQVTAIAEAQGGFVERVSGNNVSLRVPVDTFQDSFDKIQAVGDIINERVHASDVTEAFQDVSLRLDTANATRQRLIVLLAKATDENERLQLIRQIQRLTEQIDQMQSQATTLSRLAAMSRIVVALQPRQALTQRGAAQDSEAFRWIRQLSPFGVDVVRSGKVLRLDVPEGMVQLDLKGAYVAEAPDGSRIWSGRLKTDVESDGAFWANAITGRLAQDFASVEVVQVGEYTTVRLLQREDKPYTWLIAIRPSGSELHIVEAWMSSPEHTERYLKAIETVLKTEGGVL